MGGLAAIVDWERPGAGLNVDAMLSLIPHRGQGAAKHYSTAALGEARQDRSSGPPHAVVSDGSLAIVGSIRLWNRQGLRARAGGATATADMDDRRLLLAAYRRTGIDFLRDVDGDFAFVIWDNHEHEVLAVTDRFAARPLYYDQTKSGVRFASEVKQLVATSDGPVAIDGASVAEFLTRIHRSADRTFFEGIQRVRASEYILGRRGGTVTSRYWNPGLEARSTPSSAASLGARFSDELTDSVARRVAGSSGVVSHLSGGRDSSSISAAAARLRDRDPKSTPFITASAVYPGYSNDESAWIDEIAAGQPFSHHDFRPGIDDINHYADAMWMTDGPRINPVSAMWAVPSDIAAAANADLVMTGMGGDEVQWQDQLTTDLLRHGLMARWVRAARAEGAWRGVSATRPLLRSARAAAPGRLKRAGRQLLDLGRPSPNALVHEELVESVRATPGDLTPADVGYPSLTQNLVMVYAQAPILASSLAIDEAAYASRGLDVTHPYLDRALVEFVASIQVSRRPADGSPKTLVREGFNGLLPASVLDRRTKTAADGFLDALLEKQRPEFRRRFPEVPEAARAFLDSARYESMLDALDDGSAVGLTRRSLWMSWSLMLWLEGLNRYRIDAPPQNDVRYDPADAKGAAEAIPEAGAP